MADELEFQLDMTPEEFDEAKESQFVTIPPGGDGIEREGDSIILDIETGAGDWKTPGVSLVVPIIVTQEGINNGCTAEIYPGVSKTAIGITKRMARTLGVYDRVFAIKDGKRVIKPINFAGGKGRMRFVREKTNNFNLISKASAVNVLPLASEVEELGIGEGSDEVPS